jgi:hypothetical protein
MKPFSKIRADGERRYSNGIVPKKAGGRARVTNEGRPLYDKRTAAARRLDDLMRNHLRDFPEPDEAALGLARAAALAAVRIEAIEAREMKGLAIDDERLVRLIGALSRALGALNARKPAPSSRPHQRETLQEHLEQLALKGKVAPAAEAKQP